MVNDSLPLRLDLPPNALSFFIVAPMEGYQDRVLAGNREILENSNDFLEALYRNTEQGSGMACSLIKAFVFEGSLTVAVTVPSRLRDSTQRAGLYFSFGVRFPLSRDVRIRESGITAILYIKRFLEFVFETGIDIQDGSRILEEIRKNPDLTYRRLRVVERGVELLFKSQQLRLQRTGRLWARLLASYREWRPATGITLLLPREPMSLENALLVVARRCIVEWPAVGLLEREHASQALSQSCRVVVLLALPPELLRAADSVELVSYEP